MIFIGPRRDSSAGRIEAWQKSMKHILSLGLIVRVAMAQTPPPTSMPGLKLGLEELSSRPDPFLGPVAKEEQT